MPIKNLTTNVQASFASLGILRKGGPKDPNGNKPGPDLTTFRFVGATPEIQAAFEAAYKSTTPKSVTVYLPHASIDDCYSAWCEEWAAGGLLHRCDGELMQRWQRSDGTYSDESQPCPYYAGTKQRTARNPGCKAVGRLTLLLPDLIRKGFVGYVTFLTTSKHDIMSLYGSLLDAANLRAGHPHGLRGIEWRLCRESVAISTPGTDGKRARRVKSLVRIRPSAEWVQHELASAQAEALGGMVPQLETVAGRTIDRGTGEIMSPPGESDDEDDGIVDSTATEATAADAQCDPPAYLDNPDNYQRVRRYLLANGVPETEAAALMRAWQRRCLDHDTCLAEAKKVAAAAKPANGNGTLPATEPPPAQPAPSPASAGGDSVTPDSIPSSSKPAAAVDPTPPAQETEGVAPEVSATEAASEGDAEIDDMLVGEAAKPPAEPLVEPEWAGSMRKRFIAAELPVALREACIVVWTAKGMSEQLAFMDFGNVKKHHAKDAGGTVSDWVDRAKELATKAAPTGDGQKTPEPAEGEPF